MASVVGKSRPLVLKACLKFYAIVISIDNLALAKQSYSLFPRFIWYVQVEERLVSVDELLDADEVFCTGTAVVVSPVGSITYLGKKYDVVIVKDNLQFLQKQIC